MRTTRLVVAIGGNAILPSDSPGDATSQLRRVRETSARIADLVEKGYEVVVTHGNGPQVGSILLQNEESRDRAPAMPLDVCVAQSQAQIGYMLQQSLGNEFRARGVRREVACVITQVVVDPGDPAFAHPTKPIGPYYTREDELIVKRAKGWKLERDPRGGYRRVVPSPRPLEVVEAEFVNKLLAKGDGRIVIAAGGGGIPVVREGGRLRGVEAVIDKDLASAVLARAIRAKILAIATDVPRVAVDFGTPRERGLDRLGLKEAKDLLAAGQFPPGSMGPKIEAAIGFLEAGGERVVVSDLEGLVAAVEGTAGTQIHGA